MRAACFDRVLGLLQVGLAVGQEGTCHGIAGGVRHICLGPIVPGSSLFELFLHGGNDHRWRCHERGCTPGRRTGCFGRRNALRRLRRSRLDQARLGCRAAVAGGAYREIRLESAWARPLGTSAVRDRSVEKCLFFEELLQGLVDLTLDVRVATSLAGTPPRRAAAAGGRPPTTGRARRHGARRRGGTSWLRRVERRGSGLRTGL